MKMKLAQSQPSNNADGFSLIELMIVIAIVGILIGVGYPSYSDYIKKSRRADGTLALMEAIQAMERCKSTRFTYASCTLNSSLQTSPENYYTIALSPAPTASAYTIVATPQGAQAKDDECKTISINHLGKRTSTPGAVDDDQNGCWN